MGLRDLSFRLALVGFQPLHGFDQRREARCGRGVGLGQLGVMIAGAAYRAEGVAYGVPAAALLRCGFRRFGAGGVRRLAGFSGVVLGGVQLQPEFGQPVALFQADRCRCRSAGHDRQPIPAPRSAVAGHKDLAGVEQRRQGVALFRIGDDADMTKAAFQRRRCR